MKEIEQSEQITELLDYATIGLLVHGIRAIVDPDRYPQNEFTDRAKELVMAQYGVDGGYEIPAELMELAFPLTKNYFT